MTRATAAALAALLLGAPIATGAPRAAVASGAPAATTPGGAPIAGADAAGRSELGLRFLRSYGPREYGAAGQNWAIAQDPRGVIYVGNGDGVLEYDGQRFRLIRTDQRTAVRSLAVAEDGRVYVGAKGELGYLAPAAGGELRYVSLLDRIPEKARDFADVWKTFAAADGVYFQTDGQLFHVGARETRVWTPEGADSYFHYSFRVGDRLFVREDGRGLLELVGGELRLVPGGERFAKLRIYAMLPWPAGGPTSPQGSTAGGSAVLVGTRGEGFFRLDGETLSPFPTAADAELLRDLLYTAVSMPDGGLAVGTLQGGVYLLDAAGGWRGHVDRAGGLADDTIYALSVDRQGGLWLALQRGLARVEEGALLSRFDERAGLPGTVLSVRRHQGRLYAGTTIGLFRLDAGREPRFRPVPGVQSLTWALLPHGDSLLVANSDGVYHVAGETVTQVQRLGPAFALDAAKADPRRVFVGLRDGVASLRLEGEGAGARWVDEGRLPGISEEVRTLLQLADGRLWVSTYSSGVLRVTFPPGWDGERTAPLQIERFGVAQGLRDLKEARVHDIGGEALFGTHHDVFRFDEGRQRFQPDPRFADLFAGAERWVYILGGDRQGRIWMGTKDEASGLQEGGAAVPQQGGRYAWDPRPLRRVAGGWIESLYLDDDGVVWLGGDEGLFRHDPHTRADYAQPFTALIRQVTHAGGEPIFGGAPAGREASGAGATSSVLDYGANSLRFEYSAPTFTAPEETRFQVFLEGNDRDWSAWTPEAYREVTNLREGTYRLRVRARNVYGKVSEEGAYSFRLLPPVYRTAWAYLAYALAGVLLVRGLFRFRLRRLRAEKRALEAMVAERTRDAEHSRLAAEEARAHAEEHAAEAEQARGRAEEASRAKSAFLAHMSHELRTPLNGVLGFAQLMARRGGRDGEDRRHLATILKSGEHLLGLINDVLSLSKIEAGRTTIETAPFDLRALLGGIEEMLRVRAEGKDLELVVDVAPELPRVVIGDEGRLRQILLNLLGNAIKFTERGRVTLYARWNVGRAAFVVEDSGPGIAADELQKLFSPFVQSESGRRTKEGAGLGLALSRELARLMGGDITCSSEPGMGSTFRLEVELPPAADDVALGEPADRRRVVHLAPGQPEWRVLVVDDLADNRTLLAGLLSAVGFTVAEAAGGEEAIARWRQWQPHFIWMDKRMPGLDGLDATRRIRDEERRSGRQPVPIVALSASALEHERSEILASGCDDFVPKPFREGVIYAQLAERLGAVYTYDEQPAAAGEVPAGGAAVTVARLATQPAGWLAAMRRALASGEMALAGRLVDEGRPGDPALAADLRAMLAAYRLDELDELLAAAHSPPATP